MSKTKKSSFNKLLVYAKPHQGKLFFVCFWAVTLAIISAFRPFLLNFTIDNYLIEVKKETNVIQQYFEGLMLSIFPGNDNFSNLKILVVIMFVALLLEAISQFYFSYIANWLGQDVIKDLRNKLYNHINSFKMKYFDNEPVGKLVTAATSEKTALIERLRAYLDETSCKALLERKKDEGDHTMTELGKAPMQIFIG